MNFKNESSFTLIELLIVMGILAILAVVVILVINPAEFLKQARDSTRMSELQELNKAIGVYQADGKSSFGSSSTVYVSIPDVSSTCENLGLPTPPSGWSYHCVSSSTLRNVDSFGWIPVNFTSVSWGAPLSTLPIDPVNTTSTGNYYTYVTGGSWELTALLESQRYRFGGSMDKTSTDGGDNYGRLEIGTNLTLAPFNEVNLSYLITAIPASNIYPVTFATTDQKTIKLKFLYSIDNAGSMAGWNIMVAGTPRSLASIPTKSDTELTLILTSEILYSERLSVYVNYDPFSGYLSVNNKNPTISNVLAVNNYIAVAGNLSINRSYVLLSTPGDPNVLVKHSTSLNRAFRNSIHYAYPRSYNMWKYPNDTPKSQPAMSEIGGVGSANYEVTMSYAYTSGNWVTATFAYVFNTGTLQPNLFDSGYTMSIDIVIP